MKEPYSVESFLGDTVKHYDGDGKQTGYSQRNVWGDIVHYDTNGKKTGMTYDDQNGRYSHMDASGKKIGSSYRNASGYTTHYSQGKTSSSLQSLTGTKTKMYGSAPVEWNSANFDDPYRDHATADQGANILDILSENRKLDAQRFDNFIGGYKYASTGGKILYWLFGIFLVVFYGYFFIGLLT